MADEIWLYLSIALAGIVVALIIVLFIQREEKKPEKEESVRSERNETLDIWYKPTTRTVTDGTVKEAKDKLRILDLEREILSYAVRRLYEARAEGKITEEERDNLSMKYRDDLRRIKEEISRGESIIALNELERMQEDFVKMFSERFDTLSRRIEDLRSMSGFVAPKVESTIREEIPEETDELEEETKIPSRTNARISAPKRKKETNKSKPPSESSHAHGKTEADRKTEQILAEVEKVLERLGQMEVEE